MDDGRASSRNKALLLKFVEQLHLHIHIKVTDKQNFIGLLIDIDPAKSSVDLSAPHHAREFARKAGMTESKPTDTPMATGTILCAGEPHDILPPADIKRYQELCGTAIFLVQAVRLDIAYAVGQCCRFMHAPTGAHMSALLHIARYVNCTPSFSLKYAPPADSAELHQPVAYTDASHNTVEGRPVTGTAIVLNGAAVSYSSHTQKTGIATSTCESELMAMMSGCHDTMYVRNVITAFGFPLHSSTPLHCDNKPALDAVANSRVSPRTKHINLRFQHIRELVAHGDISVSHLDGVCMPADALTKPLPRPLFSRHIQVLSGNSPTGAPTPAKASSDNL